jgi:hypothetical protein
MKKSILITVIIIVSLITAKTTEAQVHVNINISNQPVWGPAGYDYVEYYYLPDIDAYYYVPRHQFIYLSGSRWVFAASLPPRYRGYDLYSGYKVVVNEPRPYLHYREHKAKYAPYRENHTQVIIRNSNEPKYYVVKGHPHYQDNYDKHDNGKHKGWDKNGKRGRD